MKRLGNILKAMGAVQLSNFILVRVHQVDFKFKRSNMLEGTVSIGKKFTSLPRQRSRNGLGGFTTDAATSAQSG